MGADVVKRVSAINFGVVKEMVLIGVLTFPGCGLGRFLKLCLTTMHNLTEKSENVVTTRCDGTSFSTVRKRVLMPASA